MTMNERTNKLLTLGEQQSREWPDYLNAFSLTEADIPDLIAMLCDEKLHNANTDSKEVWAPLHAWRALGQLKAEDAILPLIEQFQTLCDDDWALSEMSMVLGMIGEPAIQPLADYFQSRKHQEYPRVMAMDSLAEIAKNHPETRTQILGIFNDYMKQPDENLKGFNGFLISHLMDLKADELIEEIRTMYQNDCIDISIPGDLEDAEIALGLRDFRETPKPHYGLMQQSHDAEHFDSDDDIDQETDYICSEIDHFLEKYGHDDSILDASELDGFFASLACAPNTIMPSVWMPAIWGGEDKSPEWEDQEEANFFIELLMEQYNKVMSDLLTGNYGAIFLRYEREGKTYVIVDEWCEGFTRALPLWPISKYQHDTALLEFLTNISLFTTDEGLKALQQLSDNEIRKRQDLIEPALYQLHHHYFSKRDQAITSGSHTIVRNEPKTGRNDPCPCGSGKKFKKCCLH